MIYNFGLKVEHPVYLSFVRQPVLAKEDSVLKPTLLHFKKISVGGLNLM